MSARRPKTALAVRYLVLSAAALIFVAPILFLLAGSLRPESEVLGGELGWRSLVPLDPTLENYRDVFSRVPFGRYLVSSLVINAGIVGLGLVVNGCAAYALARLRWRGRRAVLGAVLALLVVPFEGIAVPLFFQVTAVGWRDSYSVQILPFVAWPLAIYLLHSFFLALPRELEDAARLDGAGPWRAFLSVVVPNSRPAFAAAALVTLVLFWGLFLWPLVVTTRASVRPLPLAVATFHTLPPLQWGDILAFGVLMVTPVVAVFVLFQRAFVRGVAATGVKG